MEKLLDIYSDYLISQNKYATATGLSALLDGEISHDKVTRFLNKEEFDSKDLWKYVKDRVGKYQQESGGILIIDDSIEEKPYTDENEIVCWHFAHDKGRNVKGINIISCLVRYGDVSLPISYDIVRKDVESSKEGTKKVKKTSSVTKNERFRALLEQAVKNRVNFEYVLADTWFCSKENMLMIHYNLEKKFILGIKSNRLVALSTPEQSKEQYQNLDSLQLKDNESRKVWLKDIPFEVVIVKKVFKNEDGTEGTLYLVSNDLGKDTDSLYSIYQKRWRIEEYHKSIKQNVSLEKSPTKIERSQKNHIFASIIGYCKLEFLKLHTSINHFGLKYKLVLKANQAAFQELRKLQATIVGA